MLFSSITFLYYFLPIILCLYFLVPKNIKNVVLLCGSLFFYFCGEPIYTVLLIFSSISDYIHSLYIEKYRGTKKAKIALLSSLCINLGMLGFFKYTDFMIENINGIFQTTIPLLRIGLPIGISFFTFQTMSYTIDVYRGNTKAQKNLVTFATFVCLFPQLVAGPIVRYTDIAKELKERKQTLTYFADGIRRFVFGLAKKVLLANSFGELCLIFQQSKERTVLFFWIYAISFTLQIYFDFSGYSDMAIGLGKIFGFQFPENFQYPYVSKSITEFWRRWHMTLGGWFRDYVYIPLGGNRTSKGKWIRNIFIVWFLTGFWHGAAWNFMLWGLIFGILLLLEKLWLGKWLLKLPTFFQHGYVLFFITLSFVLFNASSVGEAGTYIASMFGRGETSGMISGRESIYYLRSYSVIFIIGLIGSTPILAKIGNGIMQQKKGAWIWSILEVFLILTLLIISTAYLVDGSFNPFLYFRF